MQVEKPGLPCVLFEENAKKCLVVLGNGTLIQVENTGSHHLSHQSGASFAVGEDGTVLFTPQQEATSTHIIRQMDQNALEIIGKLGRHQINTVGGPFLHLKLYLL